MPRSKHRKGRRKYQMPAWFQRRGRHKLGWLRRSKTHSIWYKLARGWNHRAPQTIMERALGQRPWRPAYTFRADAAERGGPGKGRKLGPWRAWKRKKKAA